MFHSFTGLLVEVLEDVIFLYIHSVSTALLYVCGSERNFTNFKTSMAHREPLLEDFMLRLILF